MKRITLILATGLLFASFACPGVLRAQAEPQSAAAAKITLKSLAAQVSALQATVSSLQSTVSSLQTTVSSLQDELQNFAVVASDGTLVRGSSSVVSAGHFSFPGEYEVTFNKDLTNCAYQATIGDTDSGATDPGEIWVATLFGNNHGVYVETHDSAGAFSDRPFHLYVSCPDPILVW